MARLDRKTLIVFGKDGTTDNFGKFGSKTAGAAVETKDIDVIQALPAWKNGMQDAIEGSTKAPFLQDFNSLMLVHSRMTAYLYQEGVPEWAVGTTYYKFSVVKRAGTFELYGSLTDDNLGNALPVQADNAQWVWLNRPAWSVGDIKWGAWTLDTIEFGFLPATFGTLGKAGSGADYAGNAYKSLYDTLQNRFGGTYDWDGLGKVNLPDFQGRSPMGAGTGAGLTPRALGARLGEEAHLQTLAEMVAHAHGITDPGHIHALTQILGNANVLGRQGYYDRAQGGAQAGWTTDPHLTGITVNPTGGGAPFNVTHPVQIVNAIIKY